MIGADSAIEVITRLASACAAYLALEAILERENYQDHSLLGWPVMKARSARLVKSWWAPAIDLAMRYPAFLAVSWLRLILSLTTLLGPGELLNSGVRPWLMSGLLIAALLFNARTSFGTDGADQMNALTWVALTVDAFVPTPLVRGAALWFLAGQVVLSYFSAGVWKLAGEDWRKGHAMWLIFSTRMYGLPPAGLWLKKHPAVSFAAAWMVMLAESLFPTVFFAPAPIAWGFIAWGISFHVLNALVMGLNTFLWAFLACYPALICCVFGQPFHGRAGG